jgi:hypothetical protein
MSPAKNVTLSLVSICLLMGSRSNCNSGPASIDCSSPISLTGIPGSSTEFTNNCGDGLWVQGDSWYLNTTPSGISVTRSCFNGRATRRCPVSQLKTR